MKHFFSILMLIVSGFSLKAQSLFSFNDTTLRTGEVIPQFCIRNNVGHLNIISLVHDDLFSPLLDIGFPFTYFGNNYSRCTVSDNLVLSFDTSNANRISHYSWTGSGIYSYQFHNSILPAYMDLRQRNERIELRYATTYDSTFGARKFIIEWCGVPKFDFGSRVCANDKVSVQVVLHEGTNYIDINTLLINGSTTCPETNNNNPKGVQGVINMDRTVSIFTPGRGINDMWGNIGIRNNTVRFIPTANGYTVDTTQPFRYMPIFINDSFTNVTWHSSLGGAAIASGPCIDIAYDTTIDYYVASYDSYLSCDSIFRTITDTIWVHSIRDTPTTSTHNQATKQIKINVSPNPLKANDVLNIESEFYHINNIRLINSFGLTVHQSIRTATKQVKKYSLSTNSISPGMYLLVIETDAGSITKKIILH